LLKQPFVQQFDRVVCDVLHSHSVEYCQPDLMYVPTFRSNSFLPSSGWKFSVGSCTYYRKRMVGTGIVGPDSGKLVHWTGIVGPDSGKLVHWTRKDEEFRDT
jgi:hypothetical protein